MSRPDPSWSKNDAAVLAAADHKADHDAALLRLVIATALAFVLVLIFAATAIWNGWVFFIAAASLAVAGLGLKLTAINRRSTLLPWALATLDAAFLFLIAWLGPSFEDLLPGTRAGFVSLWGGFLILALMAFRPRASTILFQTALLTLNFMLLVNWPTAVNFREPHAREVDRLFSPGANIVRGTILLMTGLVLAAGAHRSRRTLKTAFRAARERSALQRFLPDDLDSYLASGDLEALQRGRRAEIGVLFADMKDFTTTAERLDAFQVADLLRSFRARAERAVSLHGGVIDKFIGDGLLAVFGVTERCEPTKALDAAVTLAREIEVWNEKRSQGNRREIGVQIGVHLGEAFIGVVGGEHRMEFTVLGDVVNVAQRLKEVAREIDAPIVASATLLEQATADRTRQWQELPNLTLRGRHAPIRAFAKKGTSIEFSGNEKKLA